MRRWRWSVIPIVIFGIVVFALTIYSAEEDFLGKGSEKGIAFLSGGVGERERGIFKEMGKGYSLKLIFSNRKGEYLSDVIIKVFDQKDKNILTTGSNGPWLFIDLPSGIYHLEASSKADRKRLTQVKIDKDRQKVVSIQW
jgi:hypothetical protein